MSDRLDPPNVVRVLRLRVTRRFAVALAIVPLMIVLAAPAHAACPTGVDQVFFSANTNVTDILVQCINNETVRLDISSWYLSEHSISIAIANRFAAGVPVRIIGDRGAIFEADPHTKAEYYWLASQGIPIRLRFNPTWFPEIVHWKAAIFVGQNLVEFGSGNFAPTELAPNSAHDYSDESEMFTRDPQIVAAFKMKFDRMWNDTTIEPQSIVSGPPYLKDWNDACANEPTGTCDFHTVYPNAAPMIVNTARLEPDVAIPTDLIFAQGPDFNNRITQEITSEQTRVDFIVYRLQVDNITQALLQKHQAGGVPVRIIVDRNQYTNPIYPEYWLTHANIDKLWAAGVPILQNNHAGVTHMKTLITSNYATNGSSNFGKNWQRDHNYFVSAIGKPAIYQAFKNEFQAMWSDTIDFVPLVTTPPNQPNIATPAPGASGVPVTTSLVWSRAAWAVSYDVYLGTSPSSMSLVANVPAELVQDPPLQYSWTPPAPLQGNTTYYWKVVSRTFANMTASTSNQLFTTGSGSGGGTLPSPWLHQDIGAFGIAGSASFSSGVFTVAGAGSDIWGTADSFHFAYQSLAGDGQIVARVVSLQNTNGNAKAGLMFRSSQSSNAAHVIIDLQPGGSIEFMSRANNGGSTSWLAGASDPAPAWLRLVRSGSTVTGSVSADGSTWTTVGSTTVTLGATASVGLAVTSHNTGQLNTATFDSVAVTPSGGGSAPGTPATPSPSSGATGVATNPTLTWSASGATSYDVKFGTANPPPQVTTGQASASYTPSTTSAGTQYFWQIVARNSNGTTPGPVWSFTTAAALPSPWVSQDVGAFGIAGSTSFSSGTFTVRGAGADIWGAADGFQFAYQTLSNDGQIVARVSSPQNTNGNAKAGVMLRGNQTAGSAHVILDVQPGGSIEFMTRSTNGGQTSWLAGTTATTPVWLRLVRSGSTVTGSVSANGSTWTTVGSTTISLPASASIGLVVTSHDTSQLNTATFDQVAVTPASGGTPPGIPSSPGPASGATGVVTNPTLTWSSSGATSYDVKLGTTNPPTTQVSTGQSASSYSTGTLLNSQQYFWQIVARNSTGTTNGPVWSFTTGASSTPANIVIYASDPVVVRHGSWATQTDATSPNNTKLISPDAGAPTAPNAAAAPTNYVDVTFSANAGTPYTLWLRLKALNNSKFNDSIFVQFSDAQAGASPIYGLSTTSGLLVNLANDSTGASLQGWGWVNGAYWLSQPTTLTFAGGGSHTLRIQVREDGVQLDQIVLSPTTFLNTPPGPASNDATIVPKP